MDQDILHKLQDLRASFAEMRGEPFRYFFCPMLFIDADVPLCRAHVVNRAFPNASRRWTVQRTDVDNFYGSFAESDFVDLQHHKNGLAEKALVDPALNRRFRPRILVDGKSVEYFVPTGPVPERFSDVNFDIGGQRKSLALKMSAADVESSPDSWEIEVAKDVRVQSVVSVLKAAHLTLFTLFGYRYALSPAGAFVGNVLGSFFSACSSLDRAEVLRRAVPHFRAAAAMVRPVASAIPELAGTIDDGHARMCWLENSTPERPWAMIVFVRTGKHLHAALMPMFDDEDGGRRFELVLRTGHGSLLTSLVRFRGDHWEGHPRRDVQRWPRANFDT